MQMAERKKRIGAQANIKQRNNLEEVRRIVIHNSGKSSVHQDVTHFERAQAYHEEMVENGANTWNAEEPKKQFYAFAKPSHFSTA